MNDSFQLMNWVPGVKSRLYIGCLLTNKCIHMKFGHFFKHVTQSNLKMLCNSGLLSPRPV